MGLPRGIRLVKIIYYPATSLGALSMSFRSALEGHLRVKHAFSEAYLAYSDVSTVPSVFKVLEILSKLHPSAWLLLHNDHQNRSITKGL